MDYSAERENEIRSNLSSYIGKKVRVTMDLDGCPISETLLYVGPTNKDKTAQFVSSQGLVIDGKVSFNGLRTFYYNIKLFGDDIVITNCENKYPFQKLPFNEGELEKVLKMWNENLK